MLLPTILHLESDGVGFVAVDIGQGNRFVVNIMAAVVLSAELGGIGQGWRYEDSNPRRTMQFAE